MRPTARSDCPIGGSAAIINCMHRFQGYEAGGTDPQSGTPPPLRRRSETQEHLALAFWIWRQLALHVTLTVVTFEVVTDCLQGRSPLSGQLVEILFR